MRIAIFHNRYKQQGGEDIAVDFEYNLLKKAGHEVELFEVSNATSLGGGKWATLCGTALTAARCHWDRAAMQNVASFLTDFQPDVGHVHNWFPLFSPAIYQAHRERGIPVVQTLHNYRLFCGNGTCWRDQKVCTDCIDGKLGRAVQRGCYRGSRMQSAVWWRTMHTNRANGTFHDLVDAYIAPSPIVAEMHLKMGLPASRMHVVSNGCLDIGYTPMPEDQPEAVFMGRLESEKGIRPLLETWQQVPYRLNVIGTGSLEPSLRAKYAHHDNIVFHGQLPHGQALEILQQSSLSLFPSLWLEPFGLGVIEAMACGRPVITAGPGAPGQIIAPDQSGIHIASNDFDELSRAARLLLNDTALAQEMGLTGRRIYEERYSPSAHLHHLLQVFETVCNPPFKHIKKSA